MLVEQKNLRRVGGDGKSFWSEKTKTSYLSINLADQDHRARGRFENMPATSHWQSDSRQEPAVGDQ